MSLRRFQVATYMHRVSTTYTPSFTRELVDSDGLSVVRQLQSYGYETYFVGGCVRDLMLGRRPKDFDIATEARPEDLKRVFGRRCRIIGRRFRLVHLYVGSQIFEIATFRGLPDDQEMADDDSGFVVRANTYGTPLEDAKSRDFTANGLFYDPVGHIVIDHVGGTPDVQGKLLRTIGQADKRLREDPVRLMRAVKFAARLGFSLDQSILDAASEAAPLITTCPAARVSEELYRMAESGYSRASFEWMYRLEVLQTLLPELSKLFSRPSADLDYALNWLDAVDRLTGAHGTLEREATFALTVWPFIELTLRRQRDYERIPWGRFALDQIRDLSLRLSIPVRHRLTLAGMAEQMRRLYQTPPRRPNPQQLRSYGTPLAMTAARVRFTLTGEIPPNYEAWSREMARMNLSPAPFEPRRDDEGPDERFHRQGPPQAPPQPPPQVQAFVTHERRAPLAENPVAEGEVAAKVRRNRRRRSTGKREG